MIFLILLVAFVIFVILPICGFILDEFGIFFGILIIIIIFGVGYGKDD